MKKIFIDGSAGTTGLRIRERLLERADITLLTLPEEKRKDPEARRERLNTADVVFLCLPDDAAREAVAMIENPDVVVLDTSTAHRTAAGWCYGFPELSETAEAAIRSAKRIAVPGCHASGFIALIHPLIKAGILPTDAMLSCTSLTGYSGGGKKMIADYQNEDRDPLLSAPRQYGISQTHKHLREMQAITGLSSAPLFLPIVADFYSGMEVSIPLFASQLCNQKTVEDIKAVYAARYNTPLLSYVENADEAGFLSAAALSGKDSMQVSVHGNGDRILLVARYDNLGKGASGAAVECLNLVLGCNAYLGLEL